MKNRILMAIIMLSASIPATFSQNYDFWADGFGCNILSEADKTIEVCEFNNDEGISDFVIPETINGYKVVSIPSNAFRQCDTWPITSITIPKSIMEIGYDGLSPFTNLKRVNISDLSSWCNIHFNNKYSNPLHYAGKLYLNGKRITNLVIPQDITRLNSYAFCGGDFSSVTLHGGVTSIGDYTFHKCNLSFITMNEGIRTIGREAFSYCSNISSLTMPESITSIGKDAFLMCNGLTRINITNLEAWCKIDFDNYASNPLYYAEKLYLNDEKITDFVVPENIKYISDYTFCGGDFSSITIPKTLKHLGYGAFYNNCKGGSVFVEDGITKLADGAFPNCKMTNITLPESLTIIGDGAFSGCTFLTSIDLPEKLDSIGDGVFSYSGLRTIVLPEGLKSMGDRAFMGCSKLRSAIISVKEIGDRTFADCTDSLTVELKEGVESIGYQAFINCNLVCLKLPKSLKKIGLRLFATNYSNLPGRIFELYIPDLTSWCGVHIYGDGSPNYYQNIEISNPMAFAKKVYINGVEFTGDLVIPDDVEALKDYTFWGLEVKSVTLPYFVKEYGRYPFYKCDELTINNPEPPYQTVVNGTDEMSILCYYTGKLYVPKSSVKRYENWVSSFERQGTKYFNCGQVIGTDLKTPEPTIKVKGRWVEIESPIPDAKLFYSMGGYDPGGNFGDEYTGPFKLNASTTLKACAEVSGLDKSDRVEIRVTGVNPRFTANTSSIEPTAYNGEVQFPQIEMDGVPVDANIFKDYISVSRFTGTNVYGQDVYEPIELEEAFALGKYKFQLDVDNDMYYGKSTCILRIHSNIYFNFGHVQFSETYDGKPKFPEVCNKDLYPGEFESWYGYVSAFKKLDSGEWQEIDKDNVINTGKYRFEVDETVWMINNRSDLTINKAYNYIDYTRLNDLSEGDIVNFIVTVKSHETVPTISGYDESIIGVTDAITEDNGDNGVVYTYQILAKKRGSTMLKITCPETENYKECNSSTIVKVAKNSGIDSAGESEINVYGKRGMIFIEGVLDDEIIEVYNSSGLCIYSGTERSIMIPTSGIYVVKIAGKAFKVAVQ